MSTEVVTALTATARFEELAERLALREGVARGTMFGVPGLRVGRRFFATLMHESLTVKLPEARVQALIAAGEARPFDPGMGRTMREWAEVPVERSKGWAALAEEALAFVATKE